jgi:hypothetical protein
MQFLRVLKDNFSYRKYGRWILPIFLLILLICTRLTATKAARAVAVPVLFPHFVFVREAEHHCVQYRRVFNSPREPAAGEVVVPLLSDIPGV